MYHQIIILISLQILFQIIYRVYHSKTDYVCGDFNIDIFKPNTY